MVCLRFQSLFPVCSTFTSIPVAYGSEPPILFLKSREMFADYKKSSCRDAQTRANLSFCIHSVHGHGDTSLGLKSSVTLCRTLCPQAPSCSNRGRCLMSAFPFRPMCALVPSQIAFHFWVGLWRV